MPWSFPGVSQPVECVYTQHVGFSADVAQLTLNPQAGNIPVAGTLTLVWGATTITLPNCEVDLGSVQLKSENRHVVLMVKDRREWWLRAKGISGEYNTSRVNAAIPARVKTLRQLGTILMTALGEASADVSVLPTNIYPVVSWDCDEVVPAAQALFSQYGFSVTLGFGAEVVKVVQLGVGAALSTTGRFIGSDTFDPKVKPRYVVSCFDPSVAQVRLKLEAVGFEPSSNTWVPINSLSYMPAGGWVRTAPDSLPDLIGVATNPQLKEALSYVRRAYRVKGFADGTWDLPDGSGSVSGLSDILPLQNRVLDTEDLRPDYSYQPYRIYGIHYEKPRQHANPPVPAGVITATDDRIYHAPAHFDGENGVVIFNEAMFYPSGSDFLPADLWLECTIQVRNQTTFAWNHYEKIIEVDAAGFGYHNVKHDLRAQTIVTYTAGHVVDSAVTNEASLDALASATANAVYAGYGATAGSHQVYANPVLTLRCDGAIQQVQHILTCGEMSNALNRTVASANYEFDRGIPSRAHRIALVNALSVPVKLEYSQKIASRGKDAND